MQTVVTRAIEHTGLTNLADRLGIWPSAAQKWRDQGFLPESELSGRTKYAAVIEELTEGKYTAEELLAATRAAWENRPAKRGKRRRAA